MEPGAMGPLSGGQDREVNVGSGSVHDRAIPGRDPQLPFGFLQSCPTAKPALYALRIHETAARGLRERPHAVLHGALENLVTGRLRMAGFRRGI